MPWQRDPWWSADPAISAVGTTCRVAALCAARALLNLVSEVHAGRSGNDPDWKLFTGLPIPRLSNDGPFASIDRNPWSYIEKEVEYWLGLRPVQLSLAINQQ
jgi:hypothetical protein